MSQPAVKSIAKKKIVAQPASAVKTPVQVNNSVIRRPTPKSPVVPPAKVNEPVPVVSKEDEPAPIAPAAESEAVLYKPLPSDTKQINQVSLSKTLAMLRYAARHGDYVFVHSAASALVDHQCVQTLRREMVKFMLSSGFLLWYPMQMLPALQIAAADLPSFFANICFDVSTTDFFNFIDVCTRRACDAQFNFARDLQITVNDCALNEKISELYATPIRGVEEKHVSEIQARAITFAYALIIGVNSCESSSFDLSWLDVALRNAFFLTRFSLTNVFSIFELLCVHYTFLRPYAELVPKVRILHGKLIEGQSTPGFFWCRATRLVVVFLIFFFFFKCTYAQRALPTHAVIPTKRQPMNTRYEPFLSPTHAEYRFARFGNLKCNLFRGYVFTIAEGVPHVPLRTIAPPEFDRTFLRSINVMWRAKYTNVTIERHTHLLVSRLNKALPLRVDDAQKALVFGPIFQSETEAYGAKLLFWMNKLEALHITSRVAECVRLYLADNFANKYGGMAFINVPLSACVRNLSDAQWDTTFVRLFASLCATHICDIGLTRDMFYEVDGRLLCAAMWMPVVVVATRFSVTQQLESLGIDDAFYEANKKYL